MKRVTRSAVVLGCCLMVATSLGLAQSRNTGEIRGTVTAGGAVVSGATVTVTNIDTGETKDYVTNEIGIYDTVSTPAGNYNIAFSAPGFKRLVRGPITLHVDVITQDASLDVGPVTETVTVTAANELLQTETSNLGKIFEAKTMEQLPQIGAGITGNDWANFNVLLPGATGSSTAPGSEGSGAYNAGDAIAINGNLPNYANYLQDGGVVQLPVSNNVDNTLFEAVQEVQITTSSFSAEYGIGGAVFNQITKQGTNAFHGSAYEYWQNSVLNARPYFGVPNKTGGFDPQKVPYIRYNEWGGSIGGPILKNKLFVYFVRDKITNNKAGNNTAGTIPTLAERGQGTLHPGAFDFTGLPTLFDPASCNKPGCQRIPFAAENTGALAGVNAIPADRLDPVAAKLLSYYPTPNAGAPGATTSNFTTLLSTPNPNLRFFGRIDYDLSAKNRVSFSISQKDNPGVNKGGPFPCPINCFSGDIDGYNAQITDTWQISPTMVNEVRMAYTKQGNWFVPDTIGFNPATSLGLQYSKANVFPQINISGADKCCSQLSPGTNAIYIEHLYDPSDVVTLLHGRHVLQFGAEVLMGEGNTTPWGNITAGNFTFTGNYTSQNGAAANTTGSGLADFLLGDVQKWSATNQKTSYARLKNPQFFVQDEIKVRPNFTLNLGLRYQATTGFRENNNSLGGFDPNLPLACNVDKNGNPCGSFNGTLGSMWFAPQNNRSSLQKPIYDIFLPRVGFAWSITSDTVLRGGYGMYAYNFSQDDYGNGIGTGALGTSTGNAADVYAGTGPTPLIALSSSAATAATVLNYVVGSANAKNVSHYLNLTSPAGETYVPYDVPVAKINEWQLSLEHQFGHDYVASLAYVGSHAANLQFPTDLNQIINPTVLSAIAAGTASLQQNRPFPAWGTLGGNAYDAISNYNALQAQITKRFSNGLNFSFNYVWSHFLDEQDSGGWGSRGGTQYWQIANDPGANYGNSNFDIPNAFKGYASYELPFGKGKPYLSGNSLVDQVVGGWRLSGTVIHQSGVPFTVVNNNNLNSKISGCSVGGTATGGDVNNGCNWFPNVTGSTHVSHPGPAEWFNTAAFVNAAPAAAFAFGDEVRNSLRGPRLTVFNMGLSKTVNFTERFHLELRSDWVNVFNHPSFNIPGQVLGGNNFGQINNATLGNGVAVAPRSGQLSAHLTF
jgi:hypothetical protein